ncbi:EamA family transporter RarD [Novosphingobium sp.]|uniref:EamA family transporter RarD n=1 Tax=Novosphingobium sp. TaxID=1874826 RepID=UPI0025EAFACA|nr:EamA family transporter RarD [Novosphingobium sp.]MCC6924969.1 EamA family transporter RarD [Novosphingobium sp.]
MDRQPPSQPHGGLPMALGAYLIWGVMPLYLRLVHWVPPYELIGWRIICTLPICLLIVALRREHGALLRALANPRVVGALLVSSVLIAVNWTIYVVAIQSGHIFAASLGYYINPLANVLFGTLFLGERLSRRQWLAVGLAALGVSLLAWDARDMLWISLSLAVSFSSYGLVRKLAPVESLPGLTIETLLMLIPAALVTAWFAQGPDGSAMGRDLASSGLLAFSGAMTAIPLLLFAAAARRMDYSALGMVQFLAPTIVFIIGLGVFGEPLRPSQLACFACIWTAIAVFVWDILARRRAASGEQAPA